MRFSIFFLALTVLTNVVLEEPVVWNWVREPYCAWLASVCSIVLGLVGVDAVRSGTMIQTRKIAVEIVRHCDGLQLTAILFAALLAFPIPWQRRLIGLLIAFPLVLAANVLRIVLLIVVGTISYRAFDIIHVYVFQAFLVAFAVAFFVWWAQTFSGGGLARSPS